MHYQSDGSQLTTRPAPRAVTGTPGYVGGGNPVASIAPSNDDPDLMNAIMDELCGVVLGAGLTLDKTNNAQLFAALKLLRGFTVTTRTLAGSGTYIPPANLVTVLVELQAPGAGGGAAPGSSSGLGAAAGAGGGGGYISAWFTPAQIGASQVVSIGAPGAAGLVGTNATGGGTCSFGGYLTALGGAPGANAPANSTAAAGIGGGYSSTAGPTIARAKTGRHGAAGFQSAVNSASGIGGTGGDAELGYGGAQGFATDAPGGRAPDGQDYGGGGAGAGVSTTTVNGGNGAPGLARITEYCWVR